MRKILTVIVFCLLLLGCSEKPKPDFSSGFSIRTYECDMSFYEGLSYNNHQFLGTTAVQVQMALDDPKGYGIFVLSRVGCEHCQMVMQYINEIATELDVKVYYIDATSKEYPFIGTDQQTLMEEILKDVMNEIDGEKQLQTPTVFTIINGKIIDSLIGTTWQGNDYTDKDIEKLKKTYRKMFEPFKK